MVAFLDNIGENPSEGKRWLRRIMPFEKKNKIFWRIGASSFPPRCGLGQMEISGRYCGMN